MIYIVMYTWDYEYSRNILATLDKEKAYRTADDLNRSSVFKSEHYDVEEMVLGQVYDK